MGFRQVICDAAVVGALLGMIAGTAYGVDQQPTPNSLGMELVDIPAGAFLMGDGPSAVAVTLSRRFSLGKYEVTQSQFKKVMSLEPWAGRANVQSGDEYPAVYVDWNEATEFCRRLTVTDHESGKLSAVEEYRLPTEAEWEYACRAGTKTLFSFGDNESEMTDFAWFNGNTNTEQYAHKIGAKKANPWGLYDMHGNACEWCSDWHDKTLSGGTDPMGPNSGAGRIGCGGSWAFRPVGCQSASRYCSAPSDRYDSLGFRVALGQSVPRAKQPVQLITNSIGMDLIEIPSGTFQMGNGVRATVAVTLTRPFLIGKTEVTQRQFKNVMGTEPWMSRPNIPCGNDFPAVCLDWNDATAFCAKLTVREQDNATGPVLRAGEVYRLPTEAEWEYACRAGTQTRFSYGDDESILGEYAWFDGNTQGHAGQVGLKKPNPLGLYDTHGNVWEWCSDWHDSAVLIGGNDPIGPKTGSHREARGGGWGFGPVSCRSARRYGIVPSYRDGDLGFRVVRSQSGK